jgi:hypothetical protein
MEGQPLDDELQAGMLEVNIFKAKQHATEFVNVC